MNICSLIKGDYSPNAMKVFEALLNSSQPTESDMDRYNTVKDMYNTAKYKYQYFIRGTDLECTILWTECRSIINWFNLRGRIYMEYDKESRTYKVQLHRNFIGMDDSSNKKDNKKDNIKDNKTESQSNVKVIVEDPDILFEQKV